MLQYCLIQKLIVILLLESVGFSLQKDLSVLLIVFCALCTARASTSLTALSDLALLKSLIIIEPLLACSRLIVFSAIISALEIFFIAIAV